MDINTLVLFAKVVHFGSFAEAARQLNMPISNISRKVQQLEKSLGTRLLHRTTRQMTPTAVGNAILIPIKEIETQAQQIENTIFSQSHAPRGRIKVTAPQAFVNWPLGDWLIEFNLLYPEIEIELVTGNRYFDLTSEHIDFAFRQGPLADSNLVAREIISLQYGILASPNLLKQYADISAPEELARLPAICVLAEGKQFPWLLEHGEQQLLHHPTASFKVEDNDLALKAAEAGLGLAYLPTLKMTDKLRPILQHWWPKPVGFYLVYQSRLHLPEKDKLFLAFIQQKL